MVLLYIPSKRNLKASLTLTPDLALASKNLYPFPFAQSRAVSVLTYFFFKSVLLPRTTTTHLDKSNPFFSASFSHFPNESKVS